MATPVSVLLICKNEAQHINACLGALQWAHEVIVVDSGSIDGTPELAKKYQNAKVYQTEWQGYSGTKKWALQHTTQQWVLWIDADEIVPPALAEAIQMQIEQPALHYFAYSMPRKTYFMGQWIQHSGWYPGTVVRLFNKEQCTFNDLALHEGIEVPTQYIGSLTADLLHYSYTSVYQYFDKMNRYGVDGAKALLQRGKQFSVIMMCLSPIAAFLKFYFLKQGFRDGIPGFIICLGSGFSAFIKYVNLYYLEKPNKV